VPLDSPQEPWYLPTIPRVCGGAPRAQWLSGDSFAFLDYVDGVSNIWTSDIRETQPQQITRFDSGQILAYDFSRDGKSVVMSHGEQVNDLVIIRDFRNDTEHEVP
jgi:hypothetical protein